MQVTFKRVKYCDGGVGGMEEFFFPKRSLCIKSKAHALPRTCLKVSLRGCLSVNNDGWE